MSTTVRSGVSWVPLNWTGNVRSGANALIRCAASHIACGIEHGKRCELERIQDVGGTTEVGEGTKSSGIGVRNVDWATADTSLVASNALEPIGRSTVSETVKLFIHLHRDN